jgi:tRNA (mo5U34)-methyltransferase
MKLIDTLPDEELERLNDLLPWHCFVLDGKGRKFGRPASERKRPSAQPIPDRRIEMLDQRFDLSDKAVLEVGCFEGVHTIALAQKARRVVAVDVRIENVVKTMVRCGLFGVSPLIARWNVEEDPAFDPSCDILHHVGVLYHLLDPVKHLAAILPRVRVGIMLDTHIAPDEPLEPYTSQGRDYACFVYREQESPFSGAYPTARWMRLDDICELLLGFGFADIDVAERRAERNGPRVLISAGCPPP